MPTYTYQCRDCDHTIEHICKIAERPEVITCACSGQMRQIIVAPAIQVDTIQDTPWLRDFARTRKEARFGGKPIETRTEYRQYLKDHNLRDPHKGENITEI
ncbi:MAG: zinc ribbon domain-containing protein [Desulfobaccales bacterium]